MTEKQNPISRAASGVRRAFRRLTHRGHDIETPIATEHEHEHERQPSRRINKAGSETARPTRREPDIPLDRLDAAYTPPQTSLKASFRSDGADQQRDQEFARGVADDRWNDEDRFTNKSGDPRIGTHGRTYEAGEKRR